MLKLLYIEWLKVKNYRTFWVLGILYIASLIGVNYIVDTIVNIAYKKTPMAEMMLGTPPFEFPMVWQATTYVSSFLLFFPGLIIIILMTNEFSYKTHRQNIIDGLSRTQFILVKMVDCVIIAFVSTVVVALTAIVFGFAEGSKLTSIANVQFIGYSFVQALSYTSLALLMATFFRRSGIAIGVYFLYSVILDELLSFLFNKYAFNTGRFMPLESNDKMLYFPSFKKLTDEIVAPTNANIMLVAAVIYLVIYYFVCKKKFETADL